MALGLRTARPRLATVHATPSRAELALALAKKAAAAETLARVQAGRGFSTDAPVRAAERQVAEAQEALRAAQTAAGAALAASVASGEAAEARSPVAAARQALVAAQDGLDAARFAEAHLTDEEPAAQRALRDASDRVTTAVRAVLLEHPFITGLVERTEKIQRELLAIGGVLEALIDVNVFATRNEWGSPLGTPESRQFEAARRRMALVGTWDFYPEYRQGVPFGKLQEDLGGGLKQIAARPWLAAIAALEHDADARLPETTQ